MAELKRYSVSSDTADGEVSIKKLHTEIEDSGHVTDFACIGLEGDDIVVHGGSFSDESACDTVVSNHVECTLDEYKQPRHEEIDAKTTELIAAGFTYDSNTFSLTNLSQGNWDALKNNTDYYTWPKDICTKDNGTYSLAEANVGAFWDAYKDVVEGHIETGRVLQTSIKDAVSKAAVDAIVDNR